MTQKELMGDDWISEEEMSKLRSKTVSTLQTERSRGGGPPYAKDGRTVWYSRIGYREWMEKQMIGGNEPKSRRRR